MLILSFDGESNGLHGTIFAIGGVVIDTNDPDKLYNPIDTFSGYVDIRLDEDIDPWVQENVLPHVGDLNLIGYGRDHLQELRDTFWLWLQIWKAHSDLIVLSDFGYPVETRLLKACQDDDPSRAWNGPYPLHELGTLLLACGADPDKTNRREWWHDLYEGEVAVLSPMKQHNPLDDAWAAALCAVKALKLLRITL